MNTTVTTETSTRRRAPARFRPWGWAVTGTVLLAACLAPTTLIPIYGDDLHWPVRWYNVFGGDLGAMLSNAWISDLQPNRFNPVGREFAIAYHFLAYQLASTLQVDLHWFYRVGAFVLIWLAVLAAAFALRQAVRFVSAKNNLPLWPAFALLSAIFAVTMQLHPWSHDPTITITEVGYGVAILSFLLIGTAFRGARPEVSTWRAVWLIGVVSLVGVTFYETFVTAIMGATVLYLYLHWRALRAKTPILKPLLFLGVGVALPAIVFVVGRLYVNALPGLPPYAGTSLELKPAGLRVLAILTTGTIPGASWRRSAGQVGGIDVMNESLVTSVLIIVVCMAVIAYLLRSQPPRFALDGTVWVVIAVYGVHLFFTFVMHSFTVKYISEVRELGTVYLSYASAILVFASAVLLLAGWIPRHYPRLALLAIPLAAVFIVVQQSTNWSIASFYADSYSENRAISQAIVTDTNSNEVRCELVGTWDQVWDYGESTREAMDKAIAENYELVFGIPFCDQTASHLASTNGGGA